MTLIATSCRPSTSSRNENGRTTKTAPAPTTPAGRAAGARHWSAPSRSRLSRRRKMKEGDDWCHRLLFSPSAASHLWTPPSPRGATGGTETERGATQTSAALSPPTLTGSTKQPMATWQTAQAPPPLHPPNSGLFHGFSFYYYEHILFVKTLLNCMYIFVLRINNVGFYCLFQVSDQRGGVIFKKGSGWRRAGLQTRYTVKNWVLINSHKTSLRMFGSFSKTRNSSAKGLVAFK